MVRKAVRKNQRVKESSILLCLGFSLQPSTDRKKQQKTRTKRKE